MSTEASRSQNRRGGRHPREEGRSRKREDRDAKKADRHKATVDSRNESSKERPAPQLLTTPQERKRKISIGKRGSSVLKSFLPDLLQKSPPSSPVLTPATGLSTLASQRSSPRLHHSPTPPSLSTTASSPTTPPSLSTPPSLESLRSSGPRSDWEGSCLSRLALANSLLEKQEEPKLRGLAHSTSDTTCNLKSAR